MQLAIHQAELAAENGEIPVGAVLVLNGTLLASAGNSPISTNDPTAHAEILALREAAKKINNYRLVDSTMYVTLEPCPMCTGALIHARVARIVYGTEDPKTGALTSVYQIGADGKLNHGFEITGGIEKERCAELLKRFFSSRRKKGEKTS